MDTKGNYAGNIRRIIAYAIDQYMYFIIYGLLFLLILDKPLYSDLHNIDDTDHSISDYTNLFSWQDIVIGSLMPVVLEVLMLAKFGQTLGKFICGIRIKHANTSENITFIQVVIRSALKGLLFFPTYFYGWFYTLSILVVIAAIFFDKRKQFFYDKIAKTVVVNYKSEEYNADYVYVGIARRAVAYMIDLFILIGIHSVFFSRMNIMDNPAMICFHFLPSIIFSIFMVRRFSGTPGQLLCGISIKDINTLKNITVIQATIRYIFAQAIYITVIVIATIVAVKKQSILKYMNKQLYEFLLDVTCLSIISFFASAVFDQRKQFFYDKIAKTIAIDYKPTN